MTKEEQERAAEAGEQLDGSTDTHRQPSFPVSRKSNENNVVEKAEKQAQKTEMDGATEEPRHDRTLSSVRSPSAERSGGATGATLPVVEEDKEASSREDSVQDEKVSSGLPNGVIQRDERWHASSPKEQSSFPSDSLPSNQQLPSIPNFNRLSMGLQSSTTTQATER